MPSPYAAHRLTLENAWRELKRLTASFGNRITTALADHVADPADPHAAADYATTTEAQALADAAEAAAEAYAEGIANAAAADAVADAAAYTDSEVGGHVVAADPHPGYVLESLFDAKGDILAGSADNTPAKVTVGADGTCLQALASATPGVRWAGAPLAVTFFRSTVGANQTLPMHYSGTDGQFIVPVGWKLAIVAITAYSPLTTANTGTIKLLVEDADVSASFASLVLTASTFDIRGSSEPTVPPYTVDATSAAKMVTLQLVTSNSGGGNANFTGTVLGYLFKP